jgi:probable addiction module antidote protein
MRPWESVPAPQPAGQQRQSSGAARAGEGNGRVAEDVTAALENDNPDVFLAAVGHVVKARGMSAIAERAGLGRESLYKVGPGGQAALRHGSESPAQPRREVHRISSLRRFGTLSKGSFTYSSSPHRRRRTGPRRASTSASAARLTSMHSEKSLCCPRTPRDARAPRRSSASSSNLSC